MYSAYRQSAKRGEGRARGISFVKPEFRKKGVVFPGIDWQTNGYVTGNLWNAYDHVLRIIPGYDPETREIFHQNIKCNEYSQEAPYKDYLSDTFMEASTVQGFGETKSTFITSYQPGSKDEKTYGGDTAINVFIRNVYRSVNSKKGKPRFGVTPDMQRWAAKDGIMTLNKQSFIMQALLYVFRGNPMTDVDGNPLVTEDGENVPKLGVVSIDGKATLVAFLKALVEPADFGQPLDAIKNNKYGGFAELAGNKLFLNHWRNPETGYNELRPSIVPPGTKGVQRPTPLPLDAEDVYNWWKPWDDLIYYMSAEEQCLYLASEFGADSVNYLVGTDPIYRGFKMPDEIARAGYGRYTQFTDGVKEVTTRGSVSVPASGERKSAAVPGLAGVFSSNKKGSLLGKPKANVIPPGSGVDKNAFSNVLGQIKRATQQQPEENNTDLASGLQDDDIVDYEPESEPEDEV